MSKVLIATDGSDFAVQAATRAMTLLERSADVLVLTVVPPPVLPGAAPVAGGLDGGPIVTPEAGEELERALTEEGETALQRTVDALGGSPQRLLAHGDPAAEICRVAEDESADCIVVGSHGSGFVKRVLLGSVSHHLLQHAPCAVLVVRPPTHP